LSEVIDDKKKAIKQRDDKTNFDNPGKGQLKLGFSEFFFDFGVFF
jgi:hypothetical protein